jgi:hypothetical protein
LSYYPYSLRTVEEALRSKFPETEPDPEAIDSDPAAYILWMIQHTREMKTTSVKEAVKAGRWIGYIFRWVEELGLWNNTRTREIIRIDVKDTDDDLPSL